MEYPGTEQLHTFVRGAHRLCCRGQTVQDQDTAWYREEGDTLHNYVGGNMPRHGVVILETAQAHSFDDLDWTHTRLVYPGRDSGWLDRNARFWPCRIAEHDTQARFVHKETVETLERRGWVRIHNKNSYSAGNVRLTAEQRNWMRKHGYPLLDDE